MSLTAEQMQQILLAEINPDTLLPPEGTVEALRGEIFREIEFGYLNDSISWHYVNTPTWFPIFTIPDLREWLGLTTSEPGDPDPGTGAGVELQASATALQWRREGGEWVDLIQLADLKGSPGTSVKIRATETSIEWAPSESTEWTAIVSLESLRGPTGADAYEIAVDQGFRGTRQEWLASLHGQDGKDSTVPGEPGDDAYEVAVAEGFAGTRTEWLASLRGPASTEPGPAGLSAYEVARAEGYPGTRTEWLAGLRGTDGSRGPTGPMGPAGNVRLLPAGAVSGPSTDPAGTIWGYRK